MIVPLVAIVGCGVKRHCWWLWWRSLPTGADARGTRIVIFP
jgi:hypothetical protein